MSDEECLIESLREEVQVGQLVPLACTRACRKATLLLPMTPPLPADAGQSVHYQPLLTGWPQAQIELYLPSLFHASPVQADKVGISTEPAETGELV